MFSEKSLNAADLNGWGLGEGPSTALVYSQLEVGGSEGGEAGLEVGSTGGSIVSMGIFTEGGVSLGHFAFCWWGQGQGEGYI